MSWLSGAAEKIAELVKEINQMTVRIEGIDKEVHRMLEEYKRLLDKHEESNERFRQDLENKYNEMFQRLAMLEARMNATLDKAALMAIEGAVTQVVDRIDQRAQEKKHVLITNMTDGNDS